MTDYIFGVGKTKPTRDAARAIAKIARQHEVVFIEADLPEGYQHWFVADHLGEPFDRRRAQAVMRALGTAGHLDIDGKIKEGRLRTASTGRLAGAA